MGTIKITTKIYTSQSHHVKHYTLTTIKFKNIQQEKLTDIDMAAPGKSNFRRLNSEKGKRVGVVRRKQ